jgi:hypothetical protein
MARYAWVMQIRFFSNEENKYLVIKRTEEIDEKELTYFYLLKLEEKYKKEFNHTAEIMSFSRFTVRFTLLSKLGKSLGGLFDPKI